MSWFGRIAVIGCGRFGRAFTDLCVEAGLPVHAFDVRPNIVPADLFVPTVHALVTQADVVVLAVPVPGMEPVLKDMLPYLSPQQLVIDVGSVKLRPIAAMRRVLGAHIPWIGTHPLFGPTSLALGDRPLRVVVCPNPIHPSAQALAVALYRALGCEIVEQGAEIHDRDMASTHALAFFVAKGLLDVHAGEGVAFTPPSFQAIERTIEAVRSDAGHLFLAIHQENPYAAPARKRLVEALSSLDKQLCLVEKSLGAEADLATVTQLSIPDLGEQSPDLTVARELIDEIDQHLLDLLARRMQIALRAGRAKAKQGRAVRDTARENELIEIRLEWAKARGLNKADVREIFDHILQLSRAAQLADLRAAQTSAGTPSEVSCDGDNS